MPDSGTIASFTPLPLDRDSRTMKIAVSLQRLGYKSVVFENLPSHLTAQSQPISVSTLFTPGRSKPASSKKNGGTSKRKRVAGWLHERIYFFSFIFLYFFLRPINGLIQVPKASLYYLHEYRLFPMVYLLSRLRRVPFVYDAHDFYPVAFKGKTLTPFWRSRFLPLLSWMEKTCIKHASGMVTVNSGIAGLYQKKFSVVPCILKNSHDARMDTDIAVDIRTTLALSPDDFLIIAVGHNKEGLAVDNLIEAVRLSVNKVHVAFMGAGFQQTETMVQAVGLAGRIHFLDPLHPTQVVPFIKGADAAVILYYAMTDDYEFSLPNKFFQSISAGLPLLFPPLAEISKIATANKLGVKINPLKPDSISRAIEKLYRDPAFLKECSERASKVSERMAWHHEEKVLSDFIGSVLQSTEDSSRAVEQNR